jgi:hypothetical protein
MVVMITPVAFSSIGYQTYIIFAVINAAIVPSVYFFYPETARRSLYVDPYKVLAPAYITPGRKWMASSKRAPTSSTSSRSRSTSLIAMMIRGIYSLSMRIRSRQGGQAVRAGGLVRRLMRRVWRVGGRVQLEGRNMEGRREVFELVCGTAVYSRSGSTVQSHDADT